MARKENIILHALEQWQQEGLLSQELYETLSARYSLKSWDLGTVIRWALILGSIMLGVGLITFFVTILESLLLLVIVLTLLCGLAYYFGFSLVSPSESHYYPKSGNALIAVACLLLCGDVFALGYVLSSDRGHWPVLLLITTLLYLIVAYIHKNTLVLVFALIGFATWFGTESGYMSGWGAYFLGVNYPMRFAIVSPFVVLVGYLHRSFQVNVPESFIKAYYAVGLLYINLSLWIMSIFGNYGDISSWHDAGHFELLIFSVLWGSADVIIFIIGSRSGNKMFTGYALVFLILNLYTRYFEYFWNDMHKSLFFIVLGGISLGIGLFLERRLKRKRHSP
ncbi:hypothetical protein CSA56_04060 [candidate division KSB3 bacterium]|uniref:DUF2157 domain-containing protein n=1 Tax=candidate division KSB3 bacterium TaxID=2044937 RepID=A0A2G6KIG4_9BACT|nr:MAG: hypothetical protein CSA56_04060 [candidate division KSB3 bacterium]